MPSAPSSPRQIWWILCLLLAPGGATRAADPQPTHAAIPYGSHPHQLLDIYVPEGDGPFPVLIWYGRLWEPAVAVPPVQRMFQSGVACVGVRTRVMKDAIADGIHPPVSVCLLDARRALQYARLHAARWKLDPERIAVAGSSQGALPALYVACAGEKADPASTDPVERVSTRVSCAGAHRSQPSIDPRRMQEWVPGVEWGAPAFGGTFAESLKRRDEFQPLIERWSPECLLSKGDPPIYFENNWGLTRPDGVETMDYLVHSPRWALGFRELARQRGVACYVKFPGHPTEGFDDIWDFLARQGKAPAKSPPAPARRPFAWGVNGHPLTQVGYRDVSLSRQLDLVAELGAGWYRFDCNPEALRGHAGRFEELLTEAERRHVRLLPVLFSSPGGRSRDATPAQIRAAARSFAREFVARYKGRVTHWELSNELDTAAMIRKSETTRSGKLWVWGDADGSSPDDFHEGRYQKAKAEIAGLQEGIKAADPGAVTIVDTAGWLHYGFVERLVREDHVPFDVLAWHWYSEMGDITKVRGKLDLLGLLGGYGKPLWITEIDRRDGSRGGNAQEQARYLGQTAAQMAARPDVGAFFVYELFDEPYFGTTNPESHYGLVELAQDAGETWRVARKKAAFDAYRAAIRAAGTSAR